MVSHYSTRKFSALVPQQEGSGDEEDGGRIILRAHLSREKDFVGKFNMPLTELPWDAKDFQVLSPLSSPF